MNPILMQFQKQRITVLGDIMLDRYLWGDVSRISPEAPVPIVRLEKETHVPGGASNTADNIAALKGTVYLIGIIGADEAGQTLRASLEKHGVKTDHLVIDSKRPTIQKTRVMGNRQQLARLDKEDKTSASGATEEALITQLRVCAQKSSIIVISDYAKGTITERIMHEVHTLAKEKNLLVICDGKPQNKEWFKNSYLLTPNKKEAYSMAGAAANESPEEVGKKLAAEYNSAILMTLSEKGMLLIEKNATITHLSAQAREVFDVSGAGDTVVATLALCLCAGANLTQASTIANFAAGIVVGKLGTATATIEEIQAAIDAQGHSA